MRTCGHMLISGSASEELELQKIVWVLLFQLNPLVLVRGTAGPGPSVRLKDLAGAKGEVPGQNLHQSGRFVGDPSCSFCGHRDSAEESVRLQVLE